MRSFKNLFLTVIFILIPVFCFGEALPSEELLKDASNILIPANPEKTDVINHIEPVVRSIIPEPVLPVETVRFLPPERIPVIPEYIMGEGIVSADVLSAFIRYYNPFLGNFACELAGLYIEEAGIEGINHDVSFAQMCLETGYLGFGGIVVPEMNNFCGLGATGPGQGEWFPDPRTGVRAHIQHLKAYATIEPLKQELVDPRYKWVRHGSSPKIHGLAGTWAADRMYADKISGILESLYKFAFYDFYQMERYSFPEYYAAEAPAEKTVIEDVKIIIDKFSIEDEILEFVKNDASDIFKLKLLNSLLSDLSVLLDELSVHYDEAK